MNALNRDGLSHSSSVTYSIPEKTRHALFIMDAVEFLKLLPDSSVQLILIDPPYNLDLAHWDTFSDYISWAKQWLQEIPRVLSESGNCVIFGGLQYQEEKSGDLLEIMHYVRHNLKLIMPNLVIWYYKNGMSAHRFFANRHEEAVWYSKSKQYYFDLDSVRIPFDEETKQLYKRDKRLNPDSLEKGKNPTNVWEIGRLNGNSSERVGHPTQKPLELIRRFVRGLSFPGSTVLDFFAGSGTTGRVCVEEKRHSILVDNDPLLRDYLKKHLVPVRQDLFTETFEICESPDIKEYLRDIKKISSENKKLVPE